jgi:hypothetical protein
VKLGDVVRVRCRNPNRQLDGSIGTIILNDDDFWGEYPVNETPWVYGLCVMLSNGAVYGFLPEELEVISESR